MEHVIEVRHLKKSFGALEVLKDVDFIIDKGQVITIIGSSGSGKSTLLRCMNLLEIPDGGEILYHGEDIRIAIVPRLAWSSRALTYLKTKALLRTVCLLK